MVISNLPVQIFEHMHGSHFRAKAQGKALHISTFGILSSLQLLCTLTHLPAVTNDGGMLAILQEDHELFKNLNTCHEDRKDIYKKSSSGIVPTLQKSGIDNGKVGLIMGECD